MQAALPVAGVRLRPEHRQLLRLQGFVQILPDAVPRPDGFQFCHAGVPPIIGWQLDTVLNIIILPEIPFASCKKSLRPIVCFAPVIIA